MAQTWAGDLSANPLHCPAPPAAPPARPPSAPRDAAPAARPAPSQPPGGIALAVQRRRDFPSRFTRPLHTGQRLEFSECGIGHASAASRLSYTLPESSCRERAALFPPLRHAACVRVSSRDESLILSPQPLDFHRLARCVPSRPAASPPGHSPRPRRMIYASVSDMRAVTPFHGAAARRTLAPGSAARRTPARSGPLYAAVKARRFGRPARGPLPKASEHRSRPAAADGMLAVIRNRALPTTV